MKRPDDRYWSMCAREVTSPTGRASYSIKRRTLPIGSASMKETLRPGATKTKRLSVDKDRTISFMGEEGRVYATPFLVGDIERTCRDLLLDHADAGEDSVGMEVQVRHLAPTLLGMEVEITA